MGLPFYFSSFLIFLVLFFIVWGFDFDEKLSCNYAIRNIQTNSYEYLIIL
jgi:hypothetical protein